MRKRGIVIERDDDLDGALGTSHGGTVRLLNGLPPAVASTTLAHESPHLCTGSAHVRLCLVAGRFE